MKLSEKLHDIAEARVFSRSLMREWADEAAALEARLEAYECLQKSSQKAMEDLEAENAKLRATHFNPED